MSSAPRPFVKWAGGKTSVSLRVRRRLPEKIRMYVEPFVGGGAVFLNLAHNQAFETACISDTNPELMNAWKVIKKDVDGLISELKKPRYKYDREKYLEIRAILPSSLDFIKRAARFIYLNKTCFNGLYRVNSSGQFNVPFGKYKDPLICDEQNLRAVSAVLQKKIKINCCDYEEVCHESGKGDAIYFDPPYIPASDTSNFTGYTEGGFGEHQHHRLADLFGRLGDLGCRVVLSNSATPLALKLYKKYDMDTYMGRRSVAGPAVDRKSKGEILVFHGPLSIVDHEDKEI
jgi:DNA adenine methylase